MRRRKLARVALFMKPDVSFNPIDIGFFSADGLVLHPDTGAHLVKQPDRWH
jgi:hypothetical protein